METTNDYKYKRAKERVENLKGFYSNLLAYAMVIPFLAYINFRTTSFMWVLFPAIGWGIGLLIHGLSTFEILPFYNKGWEDRKIKEFMESDRF